jgi:glycosyltransferase involved in cell wall biosynthesis
LISEKQSQLVLFTSDFPYGTGETFLETEIVYLAKGFDEVKIVSQNISSKECRSLPENCSVERINISISAADKIKALLGVLNPLFWKELNVIKSVYGKRLSKGIIFTMLISLYRANKIKAKVSAFQQTDQPAVKQYFYSYWCDDVALGLAMAQVEFPKIKTLCRIHRWDVYFEESAVNYLPFRHTIAQQIGKIVSISQDGIDYGKAVWKTGMDDKFVLSRLGINNSVTPVIIERNYCLLVSCSNIIPVKRVQLIAEALQELPETAIKWVHFGDGSERKALETLIKKLPPNIQVELMGRRDNKEIYSYYTEHRPDLFINVSSSEGVPVSIMEAMSFGIPVIATNVGGNGEIVNNENGCLLSHSPSATEIAVAINQFTELSSAQLMERRKHSFETWTLQYNAEVNYLDFIKEICSL